MVPEKTRLECTNELSNGEASKGETADLSVRKHVGGMQEAISMHRNYRAPPVITVPLELLKRHTHANSETGSLVCLLCRAEKLQREGNRHVHIQFGTKERAAKPEQKLASSLATPHVVKTHIHESRKTGFTLDQMGSLH